MQVNASRVWGRISARQCGGGGCRPRVSASRSGGEIRATAHSGESRRGRKRQSEWVKFGCLIRLYAPNGYRNKEQCFQSHRDLRANVTL